MQVQTSSAHLLGNSPYRWIVATVLFPLQVAMGINMFGPTPLFPDIIDHYGISRSAVSILIVAVNVVLTAFLIPGGVIASRLGTRKAAAISGLLMSIGVLVVVAPNFWAIVGARLVFGAGAGILLPATTAIATEWFGQKERPLMVGLSLAGQGLGVAIGMFVSVPLADALGGWQAVLALYGAIGLLGTAAWLFLGKASPISTTPVSAFSISQVVEVFREKNAILLSLAGVGPFAVFVAFATWLPTYYHEARNMPLEQASSLVAMVPVMGIIINPISGVLMAKLGRRKPILWATGLLLPVTAMGAVLLPNTYLLAASIVVMGICFWLFNPTLFTIPTELPGVSAEKVPLVTAAALTAGNLATVFSPLLVGVMADAMGGSYVPSLVLLSLTPLLILIPAAFLPETGPKAARPHKD